MIITIAMLFTILILFSISSLWFLYNKEMRNLREDVQSLHDVIYSNEGKQVLHLRYGRRANDKL